MNFLLQFQYFLELFLTILMWEDLCNEFALCENNSIGVKPLINDVFDRIVSLRE